MLKNPGMAIATTCLFAKSPEVVKLKKLILFVAMMSLMALFTGCASTGSGSSDLAYTPPGEEIAAIEASLLVDRTLAASVISADEGVSLRAVTEGLSGSKRYRGRNYQVQGANGGMGLRRGDGSCNTVVSADGVTVGTEQCSVVKQADGSLQITRGNGTVITTPAPAADGMPTTITVDGVEWQVTFGSAEGAPLATLRNTRSGMQLVITELDDGSLTIVRDSSEVYQGRWASDGDLEFTDRQGQQKRYRYGRNK